MSVTLVRHKLSVGDYERMIQAGILAETDRVELIRGEIIEKMPINPRHGSAVKRLNRWFSTNLGDQAVIGVQDPVRLPDSEPEPDLSILRWREDQYAARHPQPEDVLLLIEVADSSLEFDREIKLPLYAEAGIVEFWILNLIDQQLEVHCDPQPDGTFGQHSVFKPGEEIQLLTMPAVRLAVADVLP